MTDSQARRAAVRGNPAKPARRATAPGHRGRSPAPAATARVPAQRGQRATASEPAPIHPARRAAAQAIAKDTVRVELPGNLGTVQVLSPERLAFYGGIATLAVLGIMDWPVALVIGVGHLLADDHHHKMLADFGEALAEA